MAAMVEFPADRAAFLDRARVVGEPGHYVVHETPAGFDWRNPAQATFVRVRLDPARHTFSAVETTGGRGGGWSWSRSFAGTLGARGLEGVSWSDTNPRLVLRQPGKELGWRERVPATVALGIAGAGVGLLALVLLAVVAVAVLVS